MDGMSQCGYHVQKNAEKMYAFEMDVMCQAPMLSCKTKCRKNVDVLIPKSKITCSSNHMLLTCIF